MRSAPVPIVVAAILVALLLLPGARASPALTHYIPRTNDRFDYSEWINVTDGTGNYSGYEENDHFAGSITVTGVATNGTVAANYSASGTISDTEGGGGPWSESGSFSFSAVTFLYVQGTDNQTGYVNPSVWFYMDNTLGAGGSFTLLNTPMTVESTDATYRTGLTPTGYAETISSQGSGSYERNDEYGVFSAQYVWDAYFDPSTGYVVGYTYTETDSNSAGDGFTYTDTLRDTSTTFPLTAAAAPSTSSSGSGISPLAIVAIVVVVLVVVIVLVAILRRRSRSRLPRHPTAAVPGALPTYAPPPGINLTPKDQPTIQQVVIRETVKVPCRYCGTLIDSTATNCPNCGAPRT